MSTLPFARFIRSEDLLGDLTVAFRLARRRPDLQERSCASARLASVAISPFSRVFAWLRQKRAVLCAQKMGFLKMVGFRSVVL